MRQFYSSPIQLQFRLMSMARSRIAVLIALLVLSTGCDSDPSEDLTGIEALMAEYGHHGVSIAVVNGEDVQLEMYGIRNAETGDLITTSTVFQAASISKLVTAVAALRFVEEGKLDLDEPINSYLTSWQIPSNSFADEVPVTLRHLLSHTAGTTVHGFPGYAAGEPVPSLIQVLNGEPPANTEPVVVDKTPGGFFRYSGGGYCIVQQALIDVAGKPFPTVMRETVFDPLGMSQSTFEQPLPTSWTSKAAIAHGEDGDVISGLYHTYPEMAAAGLWTTPADLARLQMDLQAAIAGETGRLLSPEMVGVMMTPIRGQYGLGVLPESVNGARYFLHSGLNAGFRAAFEGHRTDRIGVVIMANGERGGFLGEVQRFIARREDWPGY